MAEPKRKTSKAAWRDFREKLEKYLGDDQPRELAYAVRDMLSRAATVGLSDAHVKQIGDKYGLKGEDKERLLELKQKWEKFESEYEKLKEKYEPVRFDQSSLNQEKRYKKWRTAEMYDMQEQHKAMETLFKKNPETLSEFRVAVNLGLGRITAGEATIMYGRLFKQKIGEIKTLGDIPASLKQIILDNHEIDLRGMKVLAKIYDDFFRNVTIDKHRTKKEVRKDFLDQVKEETGVKLSNYEFNEIWQGAQQRSANHAKAKLRDLTQGVATIVTEHQQYKQIRHVLRQMRKKSPELQGFIQLKSVVNDIRNLDSSHLKALFGTRSKSKAERWRKKIEGKFARREKEAQKAGVMSEANFDIIDAGLRELNKEQRIQAPVRPRGAEAVDKQIEVVDKLIAGLKHQAESPKIDPQLKKDIDQLARDFANWKIDNKEDFGPKKLSAKAFDLHVRERQCEGFAVKLKQLEQGLVHGEAEKPEPEKADLEKGAFITGLQAMKRQVEEGYAGVKSTKADYPMLATSVSTFMQRADEWAALSEDQQFVAYQALLQANQVVMADIEKAKASTPAVAPPKPSAPKPLITPAVAVKTEIKPTVIPEPDYFKGDLKGQFQVLTGIYSKMADLDKLPKDSEMLKEFNQLADEVEKKLKEYDNLVTATHPPRLLVEQVDQKVKACQKVCKELEDKMNKYQKKYDEHKLAKESQERIAKERFEKAVGMFAAKLKEVEGKLKELAGTPGFNPHAEAYKSLVAKLDQYKQWNDQHDKKPSIEFYKEMNEKTLDCNQMLDHIKQYQSRLVVYATSTMKTSPARSPLPPSRPLPPIPTPSAVVPSSPPSKSEESEPSPPPTARGRGPGR
jgi:hypothetical protein